MWFTRPSRPSVTVESEEYESRASRRADRRHRRGRRCRHAGRPFGKAAGGQAAPAPKIATVDILVAKSDIAMGQALSPGDMQWQAWPASAASGNFIRKTDRPNAIEKLSGYIARVPFVAGEPIREAKLVNAKGSGFMAAILPTGMRAISTQISPETGAGGFILPNDHVDVILTRRDREADKGQRHRSRRPARPFSRNVRVLAIDQTVEEKDGAESRRRQDRDARTDADARPKRWRCRSSSARCRWRCAASPTLRSDAPAADDDDRAGKRRREHRPLWRGHDDDTEMIERGEPGTWR